jgi:trehalose 2-sulfotransferase
MTRNPHPQLSYLVCATPRSGSTLLCEMLRETEGAGRPLEHFELLRHSSLPRQPREYFDDPETADVRERLPPLAPGTPSQEVPTAWWARILAEGQSPNGVWGGKLMWGHVEDFLSRVRELPGLVDTDLQGAISALLGEARLVFVTRADKVAQAVSLWRAVQTQAWRADAASQASAQYDFAAIDHLAGQLDRDERAWTGWFDRVRASPLRVSYDDLDRDAEEVVGRVLRFLGLSEVPVPAPSTRRQRNDETQRWIERYHVDREQAA